MAPLRLPVAFLLAALAVLALVASPAAAVGAPVADSAAGEATDAAACTPTTLVQVCVWSLDCIAVFVVGQPFAVIGCS